MSKPIMLSENSRKSATKLLLVNWSRFSNVPIALEGSTLFTGVNGSGKSTILDAMTYMLTGNTQFNKAALDRDRNVVSYVRGDTKSEGKNRFIREGEVTSYIAMEFWAPLENQYLVVGVCIEYVNETSNTKKWFVFKDTRIDDCRFYTVKEKEVTVYPRHELTVKGKKVPAGEFMNRDKGTEQVLRALGLRCGVEKYRAKLVKMMAFNPENNIDKFIQECVLDEHPIHSMSDIREHRNHYNEAKKVYEELANGKIQLEVVQSKIADYEASERKYEVRRILLLYQETKWHQEHRVQLEEKIDVDEKFGIGFIPLFREQYRDIANVKIEEAKQKLEEQQHVLENAFMVDFVAEINEAIREAKEEIDEINKALKDIPFGKDTYQFKMLEKPDRMVFFNLCKKLESYMNSMDVYRAMNQDDEEMEYSIRQFMDTILEEENEEEYTDYRKYFKYDMRILSRQDGEEVLADLSKKQGSASNGEKQTPYFIILAASLLQCYPKNVSCARLAFIDEAFSALSRERIEQMVKFFEDNKFQVIYAAPPEKIDSIGSHINSTISIRLTLQ